MRVKAFHRVGDPQPLVKEASVVLVEDDNGTPIAVAVSLGKGLGVHVAHADDPDFNATLRELGIRQLTVCEDFRQQPLDHLMAAPALSR